MLLVGDITVYKRQVSIPLSAKFYHIYIGCGRGTMVHCCPSYCMIDGLVVHLSRNGDWRGDVLRHRCAIVIAHGRNIRRVASRVIIKATRLLGMRCVGLSIIIRPALFVRVGKLRDIAEFAQKLGMLLRESL